MEKQNELNSIINAENYVLFPVKWFRHYLQKTNKITLDVFDKEIKPHFDESFMGLRLMFEDYYPIPKEIRDCYPYIKYMYYETIQKEIGNRYKNYIQTLMPIEVNLDHFSVYNFTRKDTEKLMKIIDINDLFEKAYFHIKKLQDKLPVEMWRKNDMVVFEGVTRDIFYDSHNQCGRWYVEKVCNKIVKCTSMRSGVHLYKSLKKIYIKDYYIIRDDKIVKYNTELGEYYKDNKY
jgi:hypothetical protein